MIHHIGKIHIIITGGTIDSTWSGKQDTAVPSEHSYLPQFFKDLNLYEDIQFTEVCHKDSRNITPENLHNIVKEVEKSPCTKIIITHGTYTMPDTARFLQANLKRKDQTIILTGSMTPLQGFWQSDASFNLGYAVAKLQNLDAGIYVCMNAATFTANEVAKNISEGKFYSIFKQKQ